MRRDLELEATIVGKYSVVAPVLDERSRRLWAAAESAAIGYGGDALVSSATGLARETIRKGRREIARGEPPTSRIRAPGAGRPGIEQEQPGVVAALETLVDPLTRGDPTSPLRWTCKSRAKLAAALAEQGWRVSSTTVGRLLHRLGYRLQSVRKREEGTVHPDRNEQFEHINATADRFLASGQPVISVDTKKKELVGNFANAGREWQPKGTPPAVRVHDFPSDAEGKAIPYGVFDMARNEAWVSVGCDHDTPTFAGGFDPALVAAYGSERLPGRHKPVHHGGRRREQRVSLAKLEARASEAGGRDPPDDSRESLPTRHEQVEQGRAPTLLPHHLELAWHPADDLRDHRRPHRQHANRGRASGPSGTGHRSVPYRREGDQVGDGRPRAGSRRVSRRLELQARSSMKLANLYRSLL